MTVPLLLLAAAFVLILANGFFVAAEFGLVTVERPDAERAAADGDRRARTVVESLKELSFQLSGTQLGITITSLGGRHARRARAGRAAVRPADGHRPARGRRLRRRRGRRHAAGLRRPDGDRRAGAQELGGLPAAAGRPLRRRARSAPSPASSGR